MILPRYWAKAESRASTPAGRSIPFAVWRWSERSVAEARAAAVAAVERVAARIRAGEPFPPRYAYADRPVREEVVRTHEDADGSLTVAVTRNTYGALVLNTARVMFLDVDEGAAPRTLTSSLGGWIRRKLSSTAPAPTSISDPAIDRLKRWLAERPAWSARVYRTRAGYRYLVTHDVFDPTGGAAHETMAALGVDEKYRALCRVQQSFRARLTPKPWRMDLRLPPARFPYEEKEQKMREWVEEYAAASQEYAVCELIGTIGSGRTHPDVVPVQALHDEMTRVASGLPLA